MGGATPEQFKAMGETYGPFTQVIVQSGYLKGGDKLKPSSRATTVHCGDGKSQLTDGPFAETREQLAGYYIVGAKILTKQSRSPNASHSLAGAVEVRPIDTMARQY